MPAQSVAKIRTEVQEEIKVRKPKFSFAGLPRYYEGGDPLTTHYSNAMQMLFPDGERFFIRMVQHFAKDIKNPVLREKVKAFVGQEMQHGLAHEAMWNELRRQGLPVDQFHSLYKSTAYGFLEPLALGIFGKKLGLSLTAALEHYTATLAEISFRHSGWEVDMPKEMVDLFKWHSAEEIEHKSVAFDVLKEVDDSYILRVAGFVIASVVLWSYVGVGQILFALGDKQLGFFDLLQSIPRFLKGNSEWTNGIGDVLLKYFEPDFHPDQIDNRSLAEEFIKNFEAEQKSAKTA